MGKSILATLADAEFAAVVRRIGLPRRTPHTITTAAALKRQLKLVRERGYSFDDEEDHEGVFRVVAAFYDHGNAAAGGISVSGLKPARDEADLHRLGAIVGAHAARLSRERGASGTAAR